MAVATVDLVELEARARLESGLRNNAYYDSASIIRYLNSGGSELYDIFTTANQHYVITTFDFTTTGQASAITPLPTDFQQGHSLEIYPDNPGQTRTIKYLSNWLNRNAFAGAAFPLSPGGFYPVYTFLDQNIRFYPPQATPAAPFRLYYTPMWTTLAAKVTRTFPAQAADAPTANTWTIAGAAFTSLDIGGIITPGLSVPNNAWNVPFTITGVSSATVATVTPNPAAIGSFTPPAGGSFSIASQPVGTRDTLPGYMAPWSEYLVVYAAMAINIDRQRPIGELERKLAALKGRIASVISVRQEEPQQPPLTRGGGPWDGGWGGGGFGW